MKFLFAHETRCEINNECVIGAARGGSAAHWNKIYIYFCWLLVAPAYRGPNALPDSYFDGGFPHHCREDTQSIWVRAASQRASDVCRQRGDTASFLAHFAWADDMTRTIHVQLTIFSLHKNHSDMSSAYLFYFRSRIRCRVSHLVVVLGGSASCSISSSFAFFPLSFAHCITLTLCNYTWSFLYDLLKEDKR